MREENVEIARKILQTLSIAAGPLNLDPFCECIAIESDAERLVHHDRAVLKLLEICPGLINFSTVYTERYEPKKWPNLVHPSIREYLFSQRIDTLGCMVN